MKHLAVLLMAVIAFLAIRFFKNYTKQIVLTFLVCLVVVSGFFMLRDVGGLTEFIRPYNQLFYQHEYLDNGVYADAILPLMIEGKTTYVKDDLDFDPASTGVINLEACLADMHYGVNSESILKAFGAKLVHDGALNNTVIDDKKQSDFEDLGSANDMFRFSGAVGNMEDKFGNYFHHQYMYYDAGQPLHIYLHLDKDDDELVALWQKKEKGYGEDLYIMDKDYYDAIK